MAKSSGIGSNVYVAGFNLSGDVQAVDDLSCPQALLVMTDITQGAPERQGGLRDGHFAATTYFDNAAGKAHPVLDALPGTDALMTFAAGTAIGSAAFQLVAKETNYAGTRDNVGNFTFKVEGVANGVGADWGQLLTAGVRTDTAATNGASIDTLASAAFGFQAYLHVMAFAGTDATVKLQDSADNSTFADLASGGFTQITSGTPGWQRIAVGGTATVRRYIRAITVTGTSFSNLQFAVVVVKNQFVVTF